jgi:Flp pilus assembly protein TadD
MSETPTTKNGGVKTFAIRVPDALHAQFVLVAALEDLSLNDTGVLAIQTLVDLKRADGDFGSRAAAALAEIEREAEARRTAIQALLSEPAAAEATTKRSRPRSTD